jgi:hypothetical protein
MAMKTSQTTETDNNTKTTYKVVGGFKGLYQPDTVHEHDTKESAKEELFFQKREAREVHGDDMIHEYDDCFVVERHSPQTGRQLVSYKFEIVEVVE